jgi:hypothetical protein
LDANKNHEDCLPGQHAENENKKEAKEARSDNRKQIYSQIT